MLTIPLAIVATRRTARRVRQLEQQARTNERLAELGTLTGGLAHEIKNPLSSINLNVQLVEEDLRDLAKLGGAADPAQVAAPGERRMPRGSGSPVDPNIDERIGRIRRRFESLSRETRRLRDILDDFLRFAGRMKLDLAPVDLNGLVSEVVDFFQPQAQLMGVTLRTQPLSVPAIAAADASLLKQALLNLMINGCQAMANARAAPSSAASASGASTAASTVAASAAAISGSTAQAANLRDNSSSEMIVRLHRPMLAKGDGVEIHVIDTGPGIPADDLAKIFQPYFSTKKGGTGLGLPTARRIVEEHGGALTVHTEPGRGSDFIIRLPMKQAMAVAD